MKLSKQTVVKYKFVAIRFKMLFFTILDWKPSDRLPVYFELAEFNSEFNSDFVH